MIALELDIFQTELRGNKNITTYIYRIQANNSIMCGYFCIVFIDFMLNGRSLLDYANLFSRNDYEKNDKIILEHFQQLETKTSFLNGL